MTLFDRLQTLHDESTTTRSKIDLILLQLDPKTRAGLEEILRNPAVSHTAIAETLTEEGYPVSESTVRRYRRKIGNTQ